MKTVKLLFLYSSVFGLLFFVGCSVAEAPMEGATDEIADKINRFVTSVLECNYPPALTLAVVKNGQVVLSKGYGHTSELKNKKTTSNTKFAIGSLTKAYTTLLLAKAVSQNANITFDTPISEYIEDFRLIDDYRTKYTNLRDLLSHRVSVDDYSIPFVLGFDPKLTRKEFVRRIKFMESSSSFREKWIYSNYMYVLAGDILEQLSGGRSWEDLVKDTILTPLGMSDTGFVDKVSDFSDFALPCDIKNGTIFDLRPELLYTAHVAGSAGTIYSTADDMAKWMNFLLADDPQSSVSGLDRSMINKAFEPGFMLEEDAADLSKPSDLISYKASQYCMGWIKGLYREYTQFFHSGGIVTYSSRLWIFPELKIGIFLSVNGPEEYKSDLLRFIPYYISDLLIGLQTSFTTEDTCLEEEDPSTLDKTTTATIINNCTNCSTLSLEPYVGKYTHAVIGDAIIKLAPSTNHLHLTFGRFSSLELTPTSGHVFKSTYTGPLSFYNAHEDLAMELEFFLDDSDSVTSFLWRMGDFARIKMENVKYLSENSGANFNAFQRSTVLVSWSFSLILCVFLSGHI